MCDTPSGQWVTPITPNRPLRNRQLFAVIRRIKIENNVWGPPCVISGQTVLSWYMHYVWHSQPATEEHLITPDGHWGVAVFDSNMRHVKHIKPWKPSRGPRWVIFDHIILSRRLSHREDSQPATEVHLITPNWPLGNGSIWQQYGARETRQTLETISEGVDV